MDEKKLLRDFGLNMKIYRKQLKLTQNDIMAMTGFSKSYISNVEAGKYNLSIVSAIKFAMVLNKNLSDMFRKL